MLAEAQQPPIGPVKQEHYFMGQAVSRGGEGSTPGRLNGIKVAIPKRYQHFPPEYEGESPWVPHKGPRPERSFDSVMTSFSVYVQLPDMKPRSPETEASFQESFHRLDKPWVSAGVTGGRPYRYPTDEQIRYHARSEIEGYDPRRKGCRFARQPQLRYGLVEYTVVCPDLEALRKARELEGRGREHQKEFFERLYTEADPNGPPVYIRCGFLPPENTRGRGSCQHMFPVPEMGRYASVTYYTGDLPRWQDIQTKLQALFASFVVPDDAPTAQPTANTNPAGGKP